MDGLGDIGGSAEERQLLEGELLRDVETDAAIRDDGRSSSMEVDVMERETMESQLVREDELNRIFGETAAAINLQTTFSKKQISECFLKEMREFTDQMHTLLCQKEFDILEAQNRETKILKENCDLQLHLSQILSTSDQAQQPPRLDYLAQFTEENQKILIEMVQYMNRNGVDSIEEMNDFCQKTSEKRRCELQKAQQEVAKFKADNLALRHEKALLKSHLAAVESQRDDWKRKEGELRRKIEWNTYSRPGRLTAVAGSSTPKIDIQTLARESHQETPPQPRPRSSYGKQQMKENNTEKEAARFYNANTQEILDDDDIPVEETLEQETHSHYHERRTTEHTDHFAQNVRDAKLAKSLPNPPKFTADENSISIEEFEEMFKMKYQFYTDKQQVLYLGTTLLGASVLHAIKIRLCLSSDDESRRAIDKFEKLTVKKGESVEDFCLRMDDVSRVAHQGMGEGAKSMQKLTKLLNNLHFADEGRAIEIAVDSAIRNVSREEQYDVARETVTRLERQRQDRQKEMSRWENEKRNTKFFNKNTNLTTQKRRQMANSNQRGQNQGTPIPSHVANQYQFQNSQNMQANQKQSFVDRTQGNWRDSQKPNELSQKCTDCNQMGPHDPRCPKAPKRYLPTCYACKEVGHYANECPVNKPQQSTTPKPADSEQDKRVAQSIREKVNLSLPSETNPEEEKQKERNVQVEKGRIGVAEVNIMLDSGACISLIGKDLWEEIVSKNGAEWGNKAKMECTEFIKVYAANNEPIKLHFQVKAETSLHSRTRDITYYVADVDRDTIILGIDHFDKLGIKMSIESEARDIRMAKTVTLYPGAKLFAEVKVGGMIDAAKNHCLVNPTVPWLSPSVCQVTTTGKGVIQVANYTKQTVVLEKGQTIATGELDGFQVIQEKAECMQILEKHFGHLEDTKDLNELICSITGSADCNEHWKVLCEHLKKESVGTKEEEEVWGIVRKFQHIFAVDDNELGRTNAVECEIELVEGAEPVRQKPRPIPLAIRPEIRKMIQKMLAQGVIRESHSPWASPVVLVKKKDGSVRMCIDYRKVNKVVRYNAHPLPNIEATLQSLSGKKVFTTLDLLAGYWQIPLKEQSKEITAFAIGSELFEWNVLPFGLVTSPAIFQATMESVIGDMLGICAFVYVDDLLIASESLEQHAKDLERVLERVEKSGMRFRASKCHIAQEQVAYLGHKITPEGVRTEEAKIDKMKKFPRPTNPKEVQSFLGLVGYYRKFVINFAQLASALTPLTAKQAVWRWEDEQEAAFQSLIQAICSTPVLMQPNTEAAIDGSKPFLIYTDASRKGVGAVLAQQGDDGEQHPIAFASKALTPAETRYHITDLEALGMIFALRRFKTIVYGTQILVYTDHKPLIYLLRGTPLADRLLRWSIELLEYNVKIIFVNGKANNVADALSRGGCELIGEEHQETGEITNIIASVTGEEESEGRLDWNRWSEKLREEEGWRTVIMKLERGETSGTVKIPGLRQEISIENYCIIGGSLRNTEQEECNRLVVPTSEIKGILREAHEGVLAGHFGVKKMYRQLSKKFYWPKMRASIESFVRSCQKCLCTNDSPKLVAPLNPYITSRPLEIVACDLVDIGVSTSGNRYMLTIIDLFTKYGTAIPIPDKKGETVLKAFVDRWAVGEGRIPETLLTDQGKEFVNDHFKNLAKILNIKHITTKGYNSRANGCVERFNKTITHIIKKKNRVSYEWDEQVSFAVFAYNSIPHETTGESPMFLMTGRDPTGGFEKSEDDACGRNYVDMDEYKNVLVQGLNQAFDMVRTHAQKEQEEYKRLFDEKHSTHGRKYPTVGSRVLVEIPSEKLGARCPKMVNRWRGPYRVIECSPNSVTVIPVSGGLQEKLQVPHEHVRVVPDQMDNTLIETRKKRARVKMDADINKVAFIDTRPINEFFCRRLMCCRCERKCTFVYRWPTGVPKTQTQELRSSSPTHLAGMVCLLEMNPDLSSEVVYGLSGKDVPSLSELPMDSLWPSFGQCPSFHIWLEEIQGWSKEYSYYHSRMIQKYLGNDLLRKAGTVVLLLPSVRPKDVMISGAEVVSLEAESWRETMEMLCKRSLQHIIMVIPFFHESEIQDDFKQMINFVPATTKLTLVPGYFSQLDYAKVPEFCRLFGRLIRDKGMVESVLPEDRVSTAQNQTLINLTGSVKQYWERVQTIVKERSMQWPTELTSTQTSSPVPHHQEHPRTAVTPGPMRTPHQKLTPAPYPREFQRTTYRRQ